MTITTDTREYEMTTNEDKGARPRRRVRIAAMDQRFETGFTRGDAEALIAICEDRGIKPAAYIREVTLAALKRDRKDIDAK